MVYTWLISFDFFPIPHKSSNQISYRSPLFTLNHAFVTLTRDMIFESFNEIVSTLWVSQDV